MMNFIYNKVRVALLLVTMILAACSSDDDYDAADDSTDTLQLVAYSQLQTDDETFATRALTDGNLGNYDKYEGPNAIGVFLASESTAPEKVSTFIWRQIDETSGEWTSQVSVKSGTNYMIYGFMPTAFENAPDFSYTINQNSNFNECATLSFKNLPSIASKDFCLLTGVQDLEGDATKELNLQRGKFNYTGKGKNQNFVNLMFEHLYAGILFQMKVGATYSTLRTIKLKEFKLKTSTSISNVTWTLQVTPNETEETPYQITSNASFQVSVSEATLFTSEEGQTLDKTAAYLISGYVYPFANNDNNDYIGKHLSIACKYDVYDRKGNLIRKDCTAENQLPAPPNGQWKSGNRIVIPLTVEPTYLYVLSNPDLDNPTITIN
jgi:hypothetical protein